MLFKRATRSAGRERLAEGGKNAAAGVGPLRNYTCHFHTDHLGSIAVISNEAGAVVERLAYDAWGKRRQPNGADDPAGSLTSQSPRGFTGHEQLDSVGLVHMNGRVYDPLLARFTSADPMTENPFSTQGWNRYSYVGNSPVNFTDPSGYCFMGCFWKPIFRAIQNLFRNVPILGTIVQVFAGVLCAGPLAPVCVGIAAAVVTGINGGSLGEALRAGFTAGVTAWAMTTVGNLTGHGVLRFGSERHILNVVGHALVGCGSAVASGAKCGPGALSGAIGSFASPILGHMNFGAKLIATSVLGGLASVAGGGKFANGAVTAAFGYLFNECAHGGCTNDSYSAPGAPSAPPGVDLDANVSLVRWTRFFYALAGETEAFNVWFYHQVKTGGPWDFKAHYGSQYETFGNYHYGAVAAAAGFGDFVIYNEAGRAQTVRPTSGSFGYPASRWSYPFGGFGGQYPFGDDPWDRYMISRGIRDYRGQ